MARTIVGELIVRLIDGVSGKAKGIAGALKDVENAANRLGKTSGKNVGDGLTNALRTAEKAARDLAASGKGIDDWGNRFQKSLSRLGASSAEIDKIRDSWRRLQGDLRGGKFDEAFRTNAVRKWQNDTVAALAAVRREADRHDRGSAATSIRRLGRNAAIVAGVVPTAYGAQRAARYSISHGAELPREQARQYLGGMSAEEQAAAAVKARDLSRKFPSIGQVAAMEHIRQLRARFGDFHHAIDGVEDLVRAQVVLQNLKGGGDHAGHDLERLVLGLEGLGAGADPKKFKQYLDAFVKAKSLFPDLRGEDFRQYLQTSKASKYGLSSDYLTNVAPTMMQHEGAAKFGTMQQTAFGALVGLRMRTRSVEQLIEHGLAEKWHKDSKGKPVLDLIKGEHDLISNPYKWATEVLQPALAAKGVTFENDKEKFVSTVTKMFSDRNAAEFFTTLLANKSVIEKDRAMLATARGTESAEEVPKRDPFVAFEGVKQQLINVVQNALEPQAARATAALNTVASALGSLADKIKNSPTLSALAAPAGIVGGGAVVGGIGAIASKLGFTNVGGLATKLGGLGALLGLSMMTGEALAKEDAAFQKRHAGIGNYLRTRSQDYTFGSTGGFDFSGTSMAGGRRNVPPSYGRRFGNTPFGNIPAPLSGGFPVGEGPAAPAEGGEDAWQRLFRLPAAAAAEAKARIDATLATPIPTEGATNSVGAITTAIKSEGENAVAASQGIWDRIRSIFSTPIRPNVDWSGVTSGAPAATPAGGGGASPSGRSSGGSVYAGSLYSVNEHRSELFVPGMDGTILPNVPGGGSGAAGQSRSMTVSFGDMHFHGVQDMTTAAAQVSSVMTDRLADDLQGLFADYGSEV